MGTRTLSTISLTALALGLASTGCSGEGDGGPGGSVAQSSATGGSTPAGVEWTNLVGGNWELDPGTESYTCVRYTLDREIHARAFRPVAPAGTHHTVLTIDDPDEPDGTFECEAGTNGPNMVYGSGVGTTDLHFPEGVAVKLPAGKQLTLNLHLFNVTGSPISSRSGIEVQEVDPADVQHEAMSLLAGKMKGLEVAPGESTQEGTCTLEADGTVFAVFPHMHQLGSHLRATAKLADGDEVSLLDDDYSFDDQRYSVLEPATQMRAGDRIDVECTYENTTGNSVHFGESSTAEMCFAGAYIYPAQDRETAYCVE